MGDSLRSGDMSSLRGDGFIFSRNVRLDRLTLAARHDLAGAGRLRRDDNAAVGRIDGRDRRIDVDRACAGPRTCVANPFWNCLLAQKENQRKIWFAANVSPACSFLVYLLKMKHSSLAGIPNSSYVRYDIPAMAYTNHAGASSTGGSHVRSFKAFVFPSGE